jgi:ribosomal protein L7/L12
MDPIQAELVELKMRVERLEQIVGQLRGQPLAPAPSSPSAFEAEIRDLLAKGQEILAIKLYREHTNCSLAEAQMRVQAMK